MVIVDYEIESVGSRNVGALVRLCPALFGEERARETRSRMLAGPERAGGITTAPSSSGCAACCFSASLGRAPVGYLAGCNEKPTELRPVRIVELQSMYVEAGRRGRRVGSALIDAFLAWANDWMVGRVSVTAYTSNAAAVRFYERVGLRPKSGTLRMPL